MKTPRVGKSCTLIQVCCVESIREDIRASDNLIAMASYTPLAPIRRLVTSHDNDARAFVHRDDLLHGEVQPHGNGVTLLWSSDSSPANVISTEDRGKIHTGLVNNGSILRIVDFPPHTVGQIHRSISLDYILVLKGKVVLTLDDGSKTPVEEGGLVVQQATMHGWDNETDEWARILCVLVPAQAPVINGVELETHVPFAVK